MKISKTQVVPVSVSLPSRVENLPHFITPVLAAARALFVDEDRCHDLELAIEESIVNIINYAYPDKEGIVRIGCRREEDCLVVCIEDEGIEFDITAADAPDLSSDVSSRKIGGLGIYLVRNLMDDVRYRREGNRNLLELVIFLHPKEMKE
ncbi:MAG: ATP-binding protein [Proteobacteria bacterium]|nr:ATP-binding protein [Pseudomonadota bacterium]